MAFAEPLTDEEIGRRLSELGGGPARARRSPRRSDTPITNACTWRCTWQRRRGVGHHPDIDIRWQRIRSGITAHDAGHRITYPDFALARHIDAIAAGHGATPVPAGDA